MYTLWPDRIFQVIWGWLKDGPPKEGPGLHAGKISEKGKAKKGKTSSLRDTNSIGKRANTILKKNSKVWGLMLPKFKGY